MTASDFITRPLTIADAPAYARTATAISAEAGANEQFDADNVRMQWAEPNFHLSDSSRGIFSADGQLAAYAVIWDNAEKPVRSWVDWGVHPAHRAPGFGQDFGMTLLCWADEKGQAVIPRCPAETRVSLQAGTIAGDAYAENALSQAGYRLNRTFYDMRIEMTEAPQVPPLPPGIAFRAYRHPEDLPALVGAVRDSFSDHFGYIEEPFEKDLEMFRHWFSEDKNFDPRLIVLALDEKTGDLAGALIGLQEDHRNPGIGYIDVVGVCRPYRRRGIAQTMLLHSFAAYWARGRRAVSLGVDGESLTNAVALYERVGMHIHQRFMSYEKVLREGVELAKMALD